MKKKLFRTVCVAAVLSMALSFAGCGSSDDDSKDNSKKTEAPAKTEASSSSAKFKTLDEYISSSAAQSQLESLKSMYSSQGIDIDVRAEDNVLVYEFKVANVTKDTVTPEMTTELESGLNSQAATFEQVASALKTETQEENPVVKISYLTSDGQVIAEKEFTAK